MGEECGGGKKKGDRGLGFKLGRKWYVRGRRKGQRGCTLPEIEDFDVHAIGLWITQRDYVNTDSLSAAIFTVDNCRPCMFQAARPMQYAKSAGESLSAELIESLEKFVHSLPCADLKSNTRGLCRPLTLTDPCAGCTARCHLTVVTCT